MLGQGGKAAAFLLAAGFCGGFCLTKGSAHLMPPRVAMIASKGGGGTSGPAGVFPGQDGAGSQHGQGSEGGDQAETGHEAEGGGTEAGSHAGKAKGAAPVAAAPVTAPPAAAPAAMTAAPGLDLLTGNTLTAVKGETTITRYLSRAGWQAIETRPGLMTVKHWALRGGQLCELTTTLFCEPISVVPDKAAGSTNGAVLGTATMAGLRWTILRGKPARMPDAIPLIDSEPLAARPLGAKVTLAGEKAVQSFLGRTLQVAGGSKGDRYETDGRWIMAKPLQPGEPTGRGGVQVAIGRWLFTSGKLCLDEPGLDLSRLCYRAEQWGPDTLRLVADRTGTVTTLVTASAR